MTNEENINNIQKLVKKLKLTNEEVIDILQKLSKKIESTNDLTIKDASDSLILTPTFKLRWYYGYDDNENYYFNGHNKVLQQLFISNYGDEYWEEVPTVINMGYKIVNL